MGRLPAEIRHGRDGGPAASAAAVNLAPRGCACPLCEAPAGEPCQPKPAADHLARYLDAYTAGQLTRAYMAKVVGELVVIDECAVIGAAAVPPLLGELLDAGHLVEFMKDPADGYVACIDVHDAVRTGIGGTVQDALDAATAGMEEDW